MTNAEKENLRDVTKGMPDEEKKFALMFYPTEFLQDELKRREIVSNQKLDKLWTILHSAKEGMTLNQMEEMFGEVAFTVHN